MADHVDQTEVRDSARLQKLPDSGTQGPDREDNGRAYSSFFRRLQIKPESHETFFHSNLKPFRNKDARLKLLAKGDEDSLQQLSEICLTALGKIVWAKERSWLLTEEELAPTDEPLWYILPKDRQPGDHDRFFAILEPLWKTMRTHIFEVKPTAQPKKGPVKAAKPTRRQHATTRGKYPPSTSSRAAYGHETAPQQKWLQERLEGAIQDIITTMETAQSIRQNYNPSDAPDTISSQATDDGDTTMVDAGASATSTITNDSHDELQPWQTSSSRHQSIPATASTTSTSDRTDPQPEPQPEPQPHPHAQPLSPPTLPPIISLPPALPTVLSAYITPFSPNSSTPSTNTYLWPNAPCHETSYPAFKSGIRLRAGIPDRIRDDKLGLVLAYAWNDACRAVMSEPDWRGGFVGDLRAAARGGVVVWRVRVCCVVLGHE